ncbi:peptidylprolyl isomerase [Vibrio scophthalmi]|uniref:Peptidyl-prolyl cis-trans isomerase n=1 Tax=Vibrio scophthalmi LMG 19158 TaxID=870967 RepID=F9RIL1_9VIBR|nr:peptidylprolyl isomerase [Vibrio scophthalmi]EGU42234.1 peptidyl-prolyl cis-trans isomerase [Vibrio scophthalmi LMG 19158]
MWKYALACFALVSNLAFAGPKVEMETNLGSIVIELNSQQAPVSVANFLKYVKDGSYVGTQFHRVIPGFMAQGGGFDTDMNRADTYAPIKNEANNGLPNNVATIAMARTNDPNSATRQFFINLADNDFLNASSRPPGYAVFGEVVQGFDVVQEMARKPTHSVGRYRDVPVEAIVIKKVTLLD